MDLDGLRNDDETPLRTQVATEETGFIYYVVARDFQHSAFDVSHVIGGKDEYAEVGIPQILFEAGYRGGCKTE